MPRNIFVVGLEDFNLRLLRKVRHAEDYAFRGLIDYETVARDPNCNVDDMLAEAFETLDAFPGPIDAIVGYWDFPTILMMPILRRRYGLRGPSLESVLRCEHKYWARLLQRKIAPDIVPPFACVDPFAEDAAATPPLPFPFWIKPVKSHSSILGFKVRDAGEYRHALQAIRDGIGPLAENVNRIAAHADLPSEVAAADGWKCIAEGIISSGRQCTLEGFVHAGKPEVYGIVDSIRGANRSSFERYEYPSTLPNTVQRRMTDAAKRIIAATGLDDSPFNMEFFWNRRTDRIWVLETNARISKSHGPLFEKVDGVPNNEVMIDIALGRRPAYRNGRGRFRHAAKFMLRHYGDGEATVLRVPDADRARRLEERFPGCEINPRVEQGARLKDRSFQDSYSFELAVVFVGANSHRTMMRTYRAIVDQMNIEIGAAP